MCRRFKTLCLFHIHRSCSHIKFRRQGITQNKEHNITHTCFYLKLHISFCVSPTTRLENILITRQAEDALCKTSQCMHDDVLNIESSSCLSVIVFLSLMMIDRLKNLALNKNMFVLD
jgi:hypothetical protein